MNAYDNNCEQLKINNKNYICNWNLLQQVPIWACYSITNANTAFLILSRFRNHHCFNHDHFKHQCPALLAKSVLCNCHGLVHSCLLCFCIFGPYWVCCRQLLYQCSNGKSQKKDIKSPPGNFSCSSAERKASWNSSAGIWLNIL